MYRLYNDINLVYHARVSFPSADTIATYMLHSLSVNVQHSGNNQKNDLVYSRLLHRGLTGILQLDSVDSIKIELVLIEAKLTDWPVIWSRLIEHIQNAAEEANTLNLLKVKQVSMYRLTPVPYSEIYLITDGSIIYALVKLCSTLVKSSQLVQAIKQAII